MKITRQDFLKNVDAESAYSEKSVTWDAMVASDPRMLAGKDNVPFTEMFNQAKAYGLEQFTNDLHTRQNDFSVYKMSFDYLKQFKWTKV